MRHSKSAKSKQVYPIIITVVILIVFAIVIFRYLPNNGTALNAQLSLGNTNLNLTDIAGMFPNVTYLPSSIDSIKNMSGALYSEGYRYVSVSEFSAQSNLSYYSTYPDIITSVIYVTSKEFSTSSSVLSDAERALSEKFEAMYGKINWNNLPSLRNA